MCRALLILLALSLIPNSVCADVRIAGSELGRYPQRWRVLSLRDLVAEVLTAGRAPIADCSAAPLFILPAFGRISSRFGPRQDPLSGREGFHPGIDVAASAGSIVRAPAGGVVIAAGPMGGCGEAVRIDHGRGVISRSCHLSAIAVRPGQRVQAGELIGRVGVSGRATGPHLHFEVEQAGLTVDPLEHVYY